MKKVILTLVLFVFSFAFINAQEKTEKEDIKQECKMDKKECKSDCKFEDQKRGHKNFKQHPKMQGEKMHMRQNGNRMYRNGTMSQDTTKSVHMKRKMMLDRRSHIKRVHMKSQMRGERQFGADRMELYLKKVHIEVSKELEAGEITKREGKKKIKEATENVQKRMDIMEKRVEEVKEKNDGTWTKDNMWNLPMDEFSNYVQYKE